MKISVRIIMNYNIIKTAIECDINFEIVDIE